ncbi:isoleucine--tRNA ligase [Helicobacter sp. 13S00401-1]|uniref:isoleucine--tRNA ligase n=1 Tax=Helicobacter sp. 13S00401-1 TaxID=1905758 RepID=UPI000BA6DE39|nr:isoleucine--tRNA ligase [Helicobacter sp. 13S00401-1]PAF49371.1 isoleucine--tRNA ligase [Helicobacter sp. 13S00401-1]
MDYKDSLILPKTNFPMKGSLPQNEPLVYKKWDGYAYKKMQELRKDAKTEFNIIDGPPYANGHLHIGHALNKILKDCIVKIHYFNNERIKYTLGWDCHGLPIEQKVDSLLQEEKKTVSKTQMRELCREHASKFVEIQKEEFKSLGVIGNYEKAYKTMDYKFEADIYRVLIELTKKGLLAQRSKPIYWSWAARSALADAEVEYKPKKSNSVYVSFKLDEDSKRKLDLKQDASFIIWTTTPWTLPSNEAIALAEDEAYTLTEDGYIVASKLYSSLLEKGIVKGTKVKELDSKSLENLKAINPLNDKESLIVLGSHVSMNEGTGAVHTAPGHGEDDYYVCLRYSLPVIMAVDDNGCFDTQVKSLKLFRDDVVDEFVGMHIYKAEKKILELLGASLLNHTEITHSYPHCWRTNKPVIYRATTQWFILMDEPFMDGKTLREVSLDALNGVRFYPASGENRLRTMIENRPDWCISRQRSWGVPIAFFIDKNTKKPLLDLEVLNHIADIFEKEGTNAWWSYEIKDLLPDSYKHLEANLEKSMHILDVWFDSGSVWHATQDKNYDAGKYPASLYLEGSDQHRGWFQSSLILSSALNGISPFKTLLTHGFTLDEKGEKMSKSKGNVIAPETVSKTLGSEIIRLWVGLADYQGDIRISNNILKQVSDNYLKIRNTLRFLLANTEGLNELHLDHLSDVDKWILSRANATFESVWESFLNYDFSKAFQILNAFITVDLSGIYLDICKDSLYCDNSTSFKRLAIQSGMCLIARRMLFTLAPFLTYTVNEALEYATPLVKNNASDVFSITKQELDYELTDSLQAKFDILLKARMLFNEGVDVLKKDKLVKSSLELSVESNYAQGDLEEFLMTSKFNKDANSTPLFSFDIDGLNFKVHKASLHKCPRCWQFNASSEDELCPRCQKVIRNCTL